MAGREEEDKRWKVGGKSVEQDVLREKQRMKPTALPSVLPMAAVLLPDPVWTAH